jgi:hypothetical protein
MRINSKLCLIISLFLSVNCFAEKKFNKEDISSYRFSNTEAKRFSAYYHFLNKKPKFLKTGWKKRIMLPMYPQNTSSKTTNELKYLLKLQKIRLKNKKIKMAIREERSLGSGGVLGGVKLTEFLISSDTPLKKYLTTLISEVFPVTIYFKDKFDRVRPHKLQPMLKPNILVPLHPAYPSGHSTHAHIYAHALSKLQPSMKKQFLSDAKRIAKNREYAGVHYPSDSLAGSILAEQVINELFANKDFLIIFNEAKSYWDRNNIMKHKKILPSFK